MPERKLSARIFSRLLRLYPREFRRRFGGEMEQNFLDLSRELEVRAQAKWLRVAWLFGDVLMQAARENLVRMTTGKTYLNILRPGPRNALMIAFLFALPMAIIFPTAVFNIEPLHSLFKAQMDATSGPGHAIAILTVMTSMILLPLGGVVALMPVMKSARSGAGILAHRSNMIFGAAVLLAGFGLWAMLLADSLRCAAGVAVCD